MISVPNFYNTSDWIIIIIETSIFIKIAQLYITEPTIGLFAAFFFKFKNVNKAIVQTLVLVCVNLLLSFLFWINIFLFQPPGPGSRW